MNTKSDTQILKGLAEMAVLAALQRQSHYGLSLITEINEQMGLSIKDGTIYPLLHRLEKQDLINAEWDTDTPNGRPRKYYQLTDLGKAHFIDMRENWAKIFTSFNAYLETST